jgi:hypothetical protein
MVVLFNIQIKIPSLSAKTVNRSVDLPVTILAVGIGLFVRAMIKVRWLKQHGTRIIARVVDSVFAMGLGAAKIVIAEWTDPRTDTTYQFRSFAPATVRVKLGESVDVLIDPCNPRRYTVTSVASISMKMR